MSNKGYALPSKSLQMHLREAEPVPTKTHSLDCTPHNNEDYLYPSLPSNDRSLHSTLESPSTGYPVKTSDLVKESRQLRPIAPVLYEGPSAPGARPGPTVPAWWRGPPPAYATIDPRKLRTRYVPPLVFHRAIVPNHRYRPL